MKQQEENNAVSIESPKNKLKQNYLLLKLHSSINFEAVDGNGIKQKVEVKINSSDGISGVCYVFNTIEDLRKFDAKADFIPIKVGE